MAGEVERDPRGDRSAAVGVGGWSVDVRGRRGSGIRAKEDCRVADRAGAEDPLVQFVRSTSRVAGNDAASRGGGIGLLPPLLYGTVTRGWHSETGVEAFSGIHARTRDMPMDPF